MTQAKTVEDGRPVRRMTTRNQNLRCILLASSLFLPVIVLGCASASHIDYLGKAKVSGVISDKSGKNDVLENGVPHNRLGAFGSAITYTGTGNTYLLCPDRGPADGATSYHCRFHTAVIEVNKHPDGWVIEVRLKDTTLLTDADKQPYTGNAREIEGNRRLDPEGIGILPSGAIMISDEYGPVIYEFDGKGCRTRSIAIPPKFLVDRPDADPATELSVNRKGRQPNRGMEGFAVSVDGRRIYGIMQSPLIQDGALDSDGNRAGLNVRILEVSLADGKTREFVYRLQSAKHGINEILAVGKTQFLVIERDSKSGHKSRCKRIYKIDISDATDVSGIDSLPAAELPDTIRPVSKTLFIDLLSQDYGIADSDMPEKLEALALGPDLRDGRALLLVGTDNDFVGDASSYIFAFAVDKCEMEDN